MSNEISPYEFQGMETFHVASSSQQRSNDPQPVLAGSQDQIDHSWRVQPRFYTESTQPFFPIPDLPTLSKREQKLYQFFKENSDQWHSTRNFKGSNYTKVQLVQVCMHLNTLLERSFTPWRFFWKKAGVGDGFNQSAHIFKLGCKAD